MTVTLHTLSWRVLLTCVWLGTEHWSKDDVVRIFSVMFPLEEMTAFQMKLDNQVSVVKVFIVYVTFLPEMCYIRILRVTSLRSRSWFVWLIVWDPWCNTKLLVSCQTRGYTEVFYFIYFFFYFYFFYFIFYFFYFIFFYL